MPAGCRSTAWFEDLFGFKESNSYSQNQAKFKLDGDVLVCPTSPYPPQHVVFQAASQFNCLEMVGPGVSPRQGISIYVSDPTQGPKCAIACPAATVYRNYLCLGGRGQGDVQIDCLSDVGAVVGNATNGYWTMQNGYALPAAAGSMRALGARLTADPALAERVEAALRVGVHWDTAVRPTPSTPVGHRVAQVFASALPVAYAKTTPSAEWEPLARCILRAAYDATLAVAACLASCSPSGRVKVFLTALGGGAFGNRHAWIAEALQQALEAHRSAPLDVMLVHYGTAVPAVWKGVGKRLAGGGSVGDVARAHGPVPDMLAAEVREEPDAERMPVEEEAEAAKS